MLSNPMVVTAIIIFVAIVIFSICLVGFGFMIKKGKDPQKYLKKADTALTDAQAVTDVVNKVIPNNPMVKIIGLIEKYAHVGVTEAEQLYLASKLPAEERNAKAKDTIYTALGLIGIQKTDAIDKIIDGVIESECLALGHSKTPEQKAAVQTAEPSGAVAQ